MENRRTSPCSPHAPIPDGRMEQIMQPWRREYFSCWKVHGLAAIFLIGTENWKGRLDKCSIFHASMFQYSLCTPYFDQVDTQLIGNKSTYLTKILLWSSTYQIRVQLWPQLLLCLTSIVYIFPFSFSIILICKLSYYSTFSSVEFNYNQLNAKVFYHMKYCFSSSLIEFDWNQLDAQVLQYICYS